MEVVASTNYRNGSLPKLITLKEHPRRDSLSSSRTRDSGYHSEPEVSFSPLDFTDPEQQMVLAALPRMQNNSLNYAPTIFKVNKAFQEPLWPRPYITSNPITTGMPEKDELHSRKGLATATSDTTHHITPSHHVKSDLELQDQEIEKWIKDNLPVYDRTKERVLSITSLSSASSCDMYTNTDMSDDEQDIQHLTLQTAVPTSTLKAIEVIMRKVEVNLRYAAYRQCTRGGSSAPPYNNGTVSYQSNQKASQNGTKRKISENHMPPNEDDEEDGYNKRRRGSLATVEGSETGAKFACPFYKHEPSRYRNRRTCPGPGWPTVHRMKEHLYRAHAQHIYCPRCYTMFDADGDLSTHLRSQHCQVSAPQPLEGIDRETLKAIRKRSPALRLEEDKWRDVYSLLFPAVIAEDIPSPFYDTDSPTEESRLFRRELLRRIQEELMQTATYVPAPIEQHLLRQVAHIIRRCESDLLTSFDASNVPALSLYDRRPSSTSTMSTNSTQPVSQIGTPNLVPGAELRVVGAPHAVQGQVGDGGSGLMSDPVHDVSGETERPVQFRPVSWDTELIDWDATFPPVAERAACSEGLGGLAVPMWSR
ncbi:hypothetical protein GQ44DRAFT_713082 [Phaeosphaeriaceae sp. PMI808]|nr:hypothetical protein GQ44DRAFT_713082 [Phaeosphaeriaceae sp. PMI808]